MKAYVGVDIRGVTTQELEELVYNLTARVEELSTKLRIKNVQVRDLEKKLRETKWTRTRKR
jgi:hypothetical protein